MNSHGNNSLEAVVDRWEGDIVVLRTTDGQELLWPSENLPAGITEGSAVRLMMVTDKELTDSKRGLAKDILNEIFDTESNSE